MTSTWFDTSTVGLSGLLTKVVLRSGASVVVVVGRTGMAGLFLWGRPVVEGPSVVTAVTVAGVVWDPELVVDESVVVVVVVVVDVVVVDTVAAVEMIGFVVAADVVADEVLVVEIVVVDIVDDGMVKICPASS